MCKDGETFRAVNPPGEGDIQITETLANPAGTGTDATLEWFEVAALANKHNTPMRIGDPGTGRTLVFDHPRPAPGVTGGVVLRLAAVEDRWHRRIDITWDEDVPVLITHHGGYRVAVDRHPDLPRVTALRLLDPGDAAGSGTLLRGYGYDDAGDLTEVIDSTGLPLCFDYDAESRVTGAVKR